jgi:hypothetical protein
LEKRRASDFIRHPLFAIYRFYMSCHDHLYYGKSPQEISRRWFFQQCGVGLGAIALGTLFRETGMAAPLVGGPLAPKQPHFAPKAKRIIFLFMAGAPSHL